jgi:hypothetical protein
MIWSTRRFRGAGVTVTVMAASLMGCSGAESDRGVAKEGEGLAAAQVCGGFAEGTAAESALEAALGAERLTDDPSDPRKALERLRDATRAPWADASRPQAVRYCHLRSATGGPNDLFIELNTAAKAPGLHPEHAKKVTSYSAGLLAYSSSGIGRLYFSCRLGEPARDLVIETAVWGPPGVPDTDLTQRTRLITVANAAARKVAAEMGCAGTGLVPGVPAETRR